MNISSKLQNRSRGTEVSENLLGSIGSFSWMVMMDLSSFGFFALPCCPAGLHCVWALVPSAAEEHSDPERRMLSRGFPAAALQHSLSLRAVLAMFGLYGLSL